MSEVPSWWLQVTGGAAIAILLLCVAMMVIAVVMVALLLEVKKGIANVSERVQSVASRVDSVAKQVEHVTTEVGTRTTGIMRSVDDIASGAFEVVERYAPVAIGLAVVFKLASMFRKPK